MLFRLVCKGGMGMKKVLCIFVLLTALFASAAAEEGYILYDTEHGGTYRMEPYSGDFVMISGEYAGCTVAFDEEKWAYRFKKDGQEALLYTDRMHECPNPAAAVTVYSPLIGGMLPESMEDVERINRAMTLLPQIQYVTVTLEGVGSGTLPVYTAPDTKSHRAANGKAAVGLKGGMVVIDWRDDWMMVFYELGGGRARVGCVQENQALRRALEQRGMREEDFDSGIHRFGRMLASAARITALTDNPNTSGDVLMTLGEGEAFTCLGRWGSLYAYAETTLEGKTVRGFVPLKDVDIPEPQEDLEAMAQLAGTSWAFYAGGSMFADFQHFRADGTVMAGDYNYDEGYGFPEEAGWDLEENMIARWRVCPYTVCRYDKAWGLYWADVPYMITYTREDGYVSRYGLRFDGDSLSLYTEEGSGGFVPYTGSMVAVPGAEE